ncbi:hypothetical protein DUNSADRAFT_2300 [Dunaliella salina]|uniref:Protein kinase domain-containing protein n=1 Tax=Dunaliella salina TaxID=3046 RepID=A0ABQ7GVV6_DUNSA|nr:hypothetical protein DUNSADRAFT_2300 [Dunaliella salina]|eukprot:KAF5838756.1 hypothetical protein DUNSADRAFT_2300 [Dunaliella salina]
MFLLQTFTLSSQVFVSACQQACTFVQGNVLANPGETGTPNASAVTWPPEHVVLENYVVIETKQSKPDFNTLDMGYVEGLFEIRDKPVILQYLHLTNIYAPCARANCEPDASGLQLLPAFFFWPVSFNRSNTLLYIDSCTMTLPARDFALVRSMARAGSQWQRAGGPMAAYFDSFQVQSSSSEHVNVQSFKGSGVAGTRVNITLNPCTSAECQRHEARAADETLSPSGGDPRSDQEGDSSRAGVLGPAIAVPVGVVVLSALGVLALLLVRRRRGHGGAFTNKSSSGDLTKSEKYAVAVQPSPYHTCSIRHETSANGNRSRHAKSRSQGAALEVNKAYSVDNMELEDMEGNDVPESALQIEVHDSEFPSAPPGRRGSQRASFHLGTLTHAARQLPSCSTLSSIPPAREQRGGGDQGLGASSKEQADMPSPLVYIQQLVHKLKTEHLVIERQLGQGGFGTVYQGGCPIWKTQF